MNLYVAGWGLTIEEQAAATGCLQKIAQDYPSLDAAALWRTPEGPAFAACIRPRSVVQDGRQYLHQQPDEIVLFNGCMVDLEGQFNAMRAEDLAVHWEQLPARLEGCFSVLRIRPGVPEMELLTDFLGMAQVFQARLNGKPVISNSVRILTGLCQDHDLDPLGTSLMLSLGWVTGDRTLNRVVQAVPGGVRWRWNEKTAFEPSWSQFDSAAHLAGIRRKKSRRDAAVELSDRMVAMLRSLGTRHQLQCPLTGGRDTRLLLSFLLRGGLQAEYYTDASTCPEDLDAAVLLAKHFHLPHRIHRPGGDISSGQWDEAAKKLVRQNDGLVSLWQLADTLPEPDEQPGRPVRLYGIGGEIARRFYRDPKILLLKSTDCQGAARWLGSMLSRHDGLIRQAVLAPARDFLRQWTEQGLNAGYRVAELPDVFYTFERVRRWAGAGANSRKAGDYFDLFAPLCTRPFVEAAFGLPVLARFSEPLHYRLIRLVPELHRLPFFGTPWLVQAPALALPHLILRKKLLQPIRRRLRPPLPPLQERSFDIHEILARNLPRLRSFCLDQAGSPLWEFVDRNRFEQATAGDIEPGRQMFYTDILCRIGTLFYYEAFQK